MRLKFAMAPVSALWLVAAIALLLALHLTHITPQSLWATTFFNSAHVVIFSAVAVLIFAGLTGFTRLSSSQSLWLAAAACLVLGAISEGAQVSGPRDASLVDLMFDYLGAGAALLIIAGRSRHWLFTVGGVLILGIAMSPLATVSAAYVWRNLHKPTLVAFDSSLANTFMRAQNADVHIKSFPEISEPVAEISLREGNWPGVIFENIWPDWRGFNVLIIDVSVPDPEALEIHIRVHDVEHRLTDQRYTDRFNSAYVLEQGTHSIQIPLNTIQNAPKGRAMDMSRIAGIVLFCTRSEHGRRFNVHEIRLQ